jgi:hypothetical protein
MIEPKEGIVIEFKLNSNADSPVLRGGLRKTNQFGWTVLRGTETYELKKLLDVKVVPDLYTELRYVPTCDGEPIKAICIKTYPATASRMKKGDLIDVIPVRYAGNVLVPEKRSRKDKNSPIEKIADEYIDEWMGKCKHLYYRTPNGDEIPDSLIHWTVDQFLSRDLDYKV